MLAVRWCGALTWTCVHARGGGGGGGGDVVVVGCAQSFVLLTDILGMEDHFGDMDFKITG